MSEVADPLDDAITRLSDLHRRLIRCFQSPTGQPAPRRPQWYEPSMRDTDAVIFAMVELERAKAEIARLSNIVCSDVLKGLLSKDEAEALSGFVKQLRKDATLRPSSTGKRG